MAPRRAALIGFGLAGSTFHAPLIEVAPGLRLATIVTSSEERARRAKEEYPGADLLGSVDQLWQRASEHELIVVATPNSSHVPLAAQAFRFLPIPPTSGQWPNPM